MNGQPYPHPQSPPMYVMPMPQHNGLGIAGFLLAFVGLIIPTGIVSLLGLILSVAALGRPPRFFAVLGVLLGLLGVVIWGAVFLAIGAALAFVAVVLAVLAMMALLVVETELATVTADLVNIQAAVIERMEGRSGAETPSLHELGLRESTILDPWGRPYRIIPEGGRRLEIVSDGPDGLPDTADDLRTSTLDRQWERAVESLPSTIKTMMQRTDRIERQSTCSGNVCREMDDVIVIDESSVPAGHSDH